MLFFSFIGISTSVKPRLQMSMSQWEQDDKAFIGAESADDTSVNSSRMHPSVRTTRASRGYKKDCSPPPEHKHFDSSILYHVRLLHRHFYFHPCSGLIAGCRRTSKLCRCVIFHSTPCRLRRRCSYHVQNRGSLRKFWNIISLHGASRESRFICANYPAPHQGGYGLQRSLLGVSRGPFSDPIHECRVQLSVTPIHSHNPII